MGLHYYTINLCYKDIQKSGSFSFRDRIEFSSFVKQESKDCLFTRVKPKNETFHCLSPSCWNACVCTMNSTQHEALFSQFLKGFMNADFPTLPCPSAGCIKEKTHIARKFISCVMSCVCTYQDFDRIKITDKIPAPRWFGLTVIRLVFVMQQFDEQERKQF